MATDVLIVDDSPTTRLMIVRVLKLVDLDVGASYQAGNGVEAIEILKRRNVDIVIADLHMPELDGRELLKYIRSDPRWQRTAIAIITSERSDETEAELFALGADFYEKKPLSPESLKHLFESLKEKIL